MDWDKDTLLSFISFIRERPAIWNSQSPEYQLKNKRLNAVEEVAFLMGVTKKEVSKKWSVLRNQLRREKKKMTGSGAESVYITKWYADKDMENLMLCNAPVLPINKMYGDYSQSSQSTLSPPPQNASKLPSLKPCTSTPPSFTPTPPSFTSIPNNIVQKEVKKELAGKKYFYKESVRTLRVMRQREAENGFQDSDDITSFGMYISSHLRKYSPNLQSKAIYEINKILYALDMENLSEYSSSATSINDYSDECQFSSGSGSHGCSSAGGFLDIYRADFDDEDYQHQILEKENRHK